MVAPDRLRFDFSHYGSLSSGEILQVETRVNNEIRANSKVISSWMELEEAKVQGAAALFGEKYDAEVRVIEMGPYSMELCGGTHVERTGDIGLFRIIQESSIASGIRRIEALTGMDALKRMQSDYLRLFRVARVLQTGIDDVQAKVEDMILANRAMEKQISDLKTQLATGGNGPVDIPIKSVGDVQLLVSRHDGIDVKDLRKIMARMQQKVESGVVVLGLSIMAKRLCCALYPTTWLTVCMPVRLSARSLLWSGEMAVASRKWPKAVVPKGKKSILRSMLWPKRSLESHWSDNSKILYSQY